MTRTRLLALLLPLSLAAASCGGGDGSEAVSAEGGGETITVEHFSGTDEVPVEPETVVVMDTGVELSLHALGVSVDGHGTTSAVPDDFADVLDDPERTPVGTAFEPDYEAINALEPDLIIVSGRSSDSYEAMSKIAPTVDLTLDPQEELLDTFRERHETLGRIFGVEGEVEEALVEIEGSVEDLSARTGGAGDALVVMTNGNEVSVYGPGSRFGLVHDVLGFGAADEGLSADANHGEAVSFEYLLDVAPDVMFVIDRSSAIGDDGAGAEQVLDNKLVAKTPAWRDGRVVHVDSFAWYIAPNSIQGLRRIVDDVESSLP